MKKVTTTKMEIVKIQRIIIEDKKIGALANLQRNRSNLRNSDITAKVSQKKLQEHK